MNKDSSLSVLYLRYKDTPYYSIGIIVLVFLVSIILFFQLVLPQISSWFSIRDEIIATRNRIDTINQNINFIDKMDKQELDNDVAITTSALPFEKGFGGMVNALTDASITSGVSLNDYSFEVGDVASVSGQVNNLAKDLSTVKLTVTVTGSPNGVIIFLNEINKRVPLSEVTDVDGDNFTTTITLQFYQKQFPKIVFKDDQPFTAISQKEATLLETFSSWIPASRSDTGTSQDSSSSPNVPLF